MVVSHLAGGTLTLSDLCVEQGLSRSVPASPQAEAPQPVDLFTPQPGRGQGHCIRMNWDEAKKTIIIPHLILAEHFVLCHT